jgi:hypothetical protein
VVSEDPNDLPKPPAFTSRRGREGLMALATLVRRMTEAGAPPEAIALAVEEIEAMQAIMDARRLKERDRKREKREAEKSQKSAVGGGMSAESRGQKVLSFPSLTTPPVPPLQTTPPLSPTNTLPLPLSTETSSRARATAWREDQEFPDDWLTWATTELGWTRSQAAAEATRFVDYALAKRPTYVRWEAAWRNWCRSPFQKTVAASRQPLTL